MSAGEKEKHLNRYHNGNFVMLQNEFVNTVNTFWPEKSIRRRKHDGLSFIPTALTRTFIEVDEQHKDEYTAVVDV